MERRTPRGHCPTGDAFVFAQTLIASRFAILGRFDNERIFVISRDYI